MTAPVITALNAKGGVGKTTLLYALAVYWSKHLGWDVLLLDTDPQGTLSAMHSIREDKGSMMATSLDLAHLPKVVARERKNHDAILVDTPGRLSEIKPAIDCCDLLLLPVSASGIDYLSFQRTWKWVSNRPAIVVPNRVKTPREADEVTPTLRALTEHEAHIGNYIKDRVGHRADAVDGLSILDNSSRQSPGVAEIEALAHKIMEILNGKQEDSSAG